MRLFEQIRGFVDAMGDGTLPREQWTHAAHLRVGAWHVHRSGLEGALQDMPPLIRRYNELSGVPNTDSSGYHETLTVAYLREIDRVVRELATATTFEDSIEAVLASGLGDSAWPHRHWSRERLWSVEARRGWVAPDLAPLKSDDSPTFPNR
jgi:hypothetical protein